MAYVVGVVLLILVGGMVLKYGFDQPIVVETVGPLHGLLYVLYLITVIDLAVKAHFSIIKTVLVMLAGTIPFVSFIAENRVAHQLKPVLEEAGTPA
jgi:integral membrane protein